MKMNDILKTLVPNGLYPGKRQGQILNGGQILILLSFMNPFLFSKEKPGDGQCRVGLGSHNLH